VSDKTGWKGRRQQLGARIGIVWVLVPGPGPPKKIIMRWNHSKGIVCGCGKLKRKFRLSRCNQRHHMVGCFKSLRTCALIPDNTSQRRESCSVRV
jgi:hypothetical protein